MPASAAMERSSGTTTTTDEVGILTGITFTAAIGGATTMWVVSSGSARTSGRDRKSTRLNSSHSQISYAVFCLKKKKKLRHNHSLYGPAQSVSHPQPPHFALRASHHSLSYIKPLLRHHTASTKRMTTPLIESST